MKAFSSGHWFERAVVFLALNHCRISKHRIVKRRNITRTAEKILKTAECVLCFL
jgi:hypothetical protein